MIVPFTELNRLRGQVTMVDGCFDPMHRGHIAYFEAASALGPAVLCNMAPEAYLRSKHPPLLLRDDRAAIIDALRYIAYTHMSDVSTVEVLNELRPRYFVKGADWRSSLPADQVQIARELGIEIVFVDTVHDSSSAILRQFLAHAGEPGQGAG